MTAERTADHVVMAYGGEVVHAARDANRVHVLACNGRGIGGFAWNGARTEVTCRICVAAMAKGRVRWIGADARIDAPVPA